MSPSRYTARFSQQQKSLEGMLQEVSGGLQRRTENWSLSKTLRGAVSEVRRNVDSISSGTSSPKRMVATVREPVIGSATPGDDVEALSLRVQMLEARNKVLAKMLGNALESLRSQKERRQSEDLFNISLAKIQFVQVYLDDPDIPIPPESPTKDPTPQTEEGPSIQTPDRSSNPDTPVARQDKSLQSMTEDSGTKPFQTPLETSHKGLEEYDSRTLRSQGHRARPSLAQSSFSWMLGEDRHRSSFVSSSTVPPEERRDSESKPARRPKRLTKEVKRPEESRKDSESEEDGFTLNSLHGGHPDG